MQLTELQQRIDDLGDVLSMSSPERLGYLCKFCGCFDQNVLADMWTVFQLLNTHNAIYITEIVEKTKLDYKYVHLILNVFDAADLTEHGCAVRGSWLDSTSKTELLAFLQLTENDSR